MLQAAIVSLGNGEVRVYYDKNLVSVLRCTCTYETSLASARAEPHMQLRSRP